MRAKDPPITANELRRLFTYDSKKGRLYRINSDGSFTDKPCGTVMKLGYRRIYFCGYFVLEHRLVWLYITNNWPTDEIDHINGNKDDNRFENLRAATKSENLANRGALANKLSSRLKGAYYDKRTNKWFSRIQKNRKVYCLGMFDTAEQANAAYFAAAQNLFGKFARSV